MILEGQYSEELVSQILHPGLGRLIWMCNLSHDDVEAHLTTQNKFWKDVLKAWCKYHYYSESEESKNPDYVIWMNSNIKIANKAVWWSDPAEHGLIYVSQLMDHKGYIPHQEAKTRFGLSDMQYNSLKSAIPSAYRKNIVNNLHKGDIHFVDPKFAKYMAAPKTAKFIYRELNSASPRIGEIAKKWEEEIPGRCELQRFCADIKSTTYVTKYASFQYRLLMRALVTNCQLFRWKKAESNQCTFCSMHKETVVHLFCECDKITPIWYSANSIMQELFGETIPITPRMIIYNEDPNPVTRLIMTVTKQYIYRCRCMDEPMSPAALRQLIYQCKNIEKYYAIKNSILRKHRRRWNEIDEEIEDDQFWDQMSMLSTTK